MSKFVIRRVASGIKFDLRADNGEIIATSEVYDSLNACRCGVESVKASAAPGKLQDETGECVPLTNPKFQIYRDKAGQFRFRLRARNGKIVAVSEGYCTKSACLSGVEAVIRTAPAAQMEI